MSYNLFLDDKRTPKECRYYPGDGSPYDTEEWLEVSNYNDFCTTLQTKGMPKLISFDYDLGYGPDGIECAILLKHYCKTINEPIPKYMVHSQWPGIYGEFKNLLG
jgi:hypothetical protein